MRKYTFKFKKFHRHIPLMGIILFFVLYFYASTLYPGGSQSNIHTEGFDWINNYWCNLMNTEAMNGQLNPARPFAILGIIILCFSLMIFFIRFADFFLQNEKWKIFIKLNGILAMIFASLIFTQYHDLMTILSSIFGFFVIIGIMRGLNLSNYNGYVQSGILCILLLAINNFIYYTEFQLHLLPVLQKITFATILIWIIGLNYKIDLAQEQTIHET